MAQHGLESAWSRKSLTHTTQRGKGQIMGITGAELTCARVFLENLCVYIYIYHISGTPGIKHKSQVPRGDFRVRVQNSFWGVSLNQV